MAITPGKWIAYDNDGTGTLPCVISDKITEYGNFYIAQCNNFGDARAIAKLPELVELLKRCQARLFVHEGCSDLYETIDAALAAMEVEK